MDGERRLLHDFAAQGGERAREWEADGVVSCEMGVKWRCLSSLAVLWDPVTLIYDPINFGSNINVVWLELSCNGTQAVRKGAV